MDEMRKQLADLMGTIVDDSQGGKKKRFDDDDVCKNYLCGICPKDLLRHTRLTMGDCGLVHSDALKAEYESRRRKQRYGYEEDLLADLDKLLAECDRKIAKAQQRVEDDERDFDNRLREAEGDEDVKRLNNIIEARMKEAEDLGASGDVGGSMKAMQEVSVLESQKKDLIINKAVHKMKTSADGSSAQAQYVAALRSQERMRMTVCDVCGAYLNANNREGDEKRASDHRSGKIHIAFLQMREKAKEIKKWLADDAPTEWAPTASPPPDADRGWSKDRSSKDRSASSANDHRWRSRSRDRDRDRDRDRARDRDRDRERDRYDSPRGRKSRRRDDSRERDRERDRDRDRSRRGYREREESGGREGRRYRD